MLFTFSECILFNRLRMYLHYDPSISCNPILTYHKIYIILSFGFHTDIRKRRIFYIFKSNTNTPFVFAFRFVFSIRNQWYRRKIRMFILFLPYWNDILFINNRFNIQMYYLWKFFFSFCYSYMHSISIY